MITLDKWNFTDEQTKKIEELKKATWVCDVEHPAGSNRVVSVFYQEEPYEGSHYFGLYHHVIDPFNSDATQLMITNGSWIEETKLDGLQADNGEVIYSHFRHDMKYSKDRSCWIDGGRAYWRASGGTHVTITFKDGKIDVVSGNGDIPAETSSSSN